jgi:hypothetical protein
MRSSPLGTQVFLPEGSTQPPARAGTVTLTLNGNGDFTSFAATGALPPAFIMGGTTLEPEDHQDYTVSLTRSGTTTVTTTLSGSVVAKAADGTTRGTLAVNSGSFTEATGLAGEVDVTSAALDVSWAVPTAEFRGTLSIGTRVTSADGAQTIPGTVSVGGTFTNVDNGTRTDFASGTFTVKVTGFDQFKAAQPRVSPNDFAVDATFSGSVTAPGRPLLRLTLGTTARNSAGEPTAVSLQYRSIVAGTPRSAIDISLTRPLGVDGATPTVTLADLSSGVSVSATRGAASADVLLNNATRIGVVNLDTGVLTFTDGSFVSVELKP